MHELAPIEFRRSRAIDWAALSQDAVRFTSHENLSATLLKASRHAALESLVARQLQVNAPIAVRAHRQGRITWLWQGPHEWLLLSDEMDGPSLAAHLGEKLRGITAAAIDVSDRILTLEISGPAAAALICKATSLDLAQLGPPGCCRTRFAGLHASLFRLSGSQDYGLIVDRALSVYLHSWLQSVLASS